VPFCIIVKEKKYMQVIQTNLKSMKYLRQKIIVIILKISQMIQVWIYGIEDFCYNIEDITNDSSLNLWHRRFSHFNTDLIKNKLKKINFTIKCKIYFVTIFDDFSLYS